MVQQGAIDRASVEVIKVTIKDKPGAAQGCRPRREEEEEERGDGGQLVRGAFAALREHARHESLVRRVRGGLAERRSRRRLREYLGAWRGLAEAQRRRREAKPAPAERKIELLVGTIAQQRQKQLNALQQQQPRAAATAAATSKAPAGGKEERQPRTTATQRMRASRIKHEAKNRLEAQNALIKEQRARIAQQERLIREMKLKQVEREARGVAGQTVSVAKQALAQCDRTTRRSIIHLMREQGCRDKSIEIPQIPSSPEFLKRMEARAEARRLRIKQVDELRQRKLDEQKKREEAKRREAEEVERQRQIQAMKEARKQRREQETKRLKEIERGKRLEELADRLYNKYLLRRYVLQPFRQLAEERNERLRRADRHYSETLLAKVFSAWKSEWAENLTAKLQLATRMHRRSLLWYAFDEWKTLALDIRHKYHAAVDFYDLKLQAKCTSSWLSVYNQSRAALREKEVKADKHCEKRLKSVYFGTWKYYVTISEDIKEREKRRDEWKGLIRKFIPGTQKPRNVSLVL